MKLYGITSTFRNEAGGDAGGDAGGGAGGDAGGGAGGDAGDAGDAGGGDAGGGDSFEARLAALEAENKQLRADKGAADEAVEAARVAALSDAEKLKEERAAFATEVETAKAAMVGERRAAAFDKLGVLPNYRDYVPAADPGTKEGAALITEWAKTHPEAVRSTAPAPAAPPSPGSKLAQLLTGAIKSPYATAESARKALSN